MDEKLAQFKNLGKLMSLSNTEGYAKTLGLEAVDVEIGKVVMKLHYHNDLIVSPQTNGMVASLPKLET
jgi:acyl-coenzyme A thioesterase PaaI-like protein